MNFLKLPLIALSLAVPLVMGNINPPPVLSAPLIAQTQTDKAYELIEQGIRYLDNQQWDYALSMFNQAISIDPSIPYGYLGRATAMIFKAPEPTLPLVKSAEKDLQKALSLMSPTENVDTYQPALELLKKVQAYRTILE
jgi:tetratricopeptide (TPR) repeat protein